VKLFFHLKIRTKFFLTHMAIIVLLLLCISIVLLGAQQKSIRMNAEEFSSELVRQAATIIEYRARDLENFTFSITNDARLHKAITAFDASFDRDQPGPVSDLLNIVNGYAALDKFVRGYGVVLLSGAYLVLDKERNDFHRGKGRMAEYPELEMIRESMRSSGDMTAWFRHPSDSRLVYFARRIVVVDSFTTLGFFIVKIDSDYFRATMQEDSMFLHGAEVLSQTPDGSILFSTLDERKLHERYIAYEARIGKAFRHDSRFHFSDSDFILSGFTTGIKGWRVISVVPMQNLLHYEYITRFAIGLVIGISLLVSSALSFGLSSRITADIKALEMSMREIEKGNFNIRMEPRSRDEIGALAVRFNIMAVKIDELINTVFNERLEKQRLEFQALLAQINPHFLYNTLGSIKWLAHKKGQTQLEDMTGMLIALLRYSLNDRGFALLREELDHIDNYLTLQKHRFEDRFSVSYEIAEDASDLTVPRFILQPLVENALFHGTRMSKGGDVITIRAFFSGSDILVLEVADDGPGFREEETMGTESQPGSRIGIKNIRERLRLHFGNSASLTFVSVEGHGTTAHVELPVRRDDLVVTV